MSKAIITIESDDEPCKFGGEPSQLNIKIEFDPPLEGDPSQATAAQVTAIRFHGQLVEHSVYAEEVARDGVVDRKVLKAWEGPSLHGPEI